MHFGKLTIIFGLAAEAWLLALTIAAGLQYLALSFIV